MTRGGASCQWDSMGMGLGLGQGDVWCWEGLLDQKGISNTMKMWVRQDPSINIGMTFSGRASDCGNH